MIINHLKDEKNPALINQNNYKKTFIIVGKSNDDGKDIIWYKMVKQ